MYLHSPIHLHPLILFLLGNIVTTATAAYTPKYSPIRYVSFLLNLIICCFALSTFHQYINTTGWAGRALAGSIFTCSVVNADRLLIRQWSYGHDFLGRSSTPTSERKTQSRWEFGSQVSGSTRCTGSEKEVSNVPYFSTQNKEYRPSLTIFLLGHLFTVIALHYLNTFAISFQSQANESLITDSHIRLLTRYGDVSGEEILTRVRVSIGYWVAQYCFLQLFYSLAAFVAVSLDPASLPSWRPLFGSLADATTVRGFWGKFWHQSIQLNVKGPAEFISTYIVHPIVLPLPPTLRRLVLRYVKILLAFSVSGVMHVVSDTGGALSMSESGALRFFCVQAVGITVEDMGQEIWRRTFGSPRKGKGKGKGERVNENQWARVGKQVIGYIWVISWLSYTTPVWVYPIVRGMEKADMLLTPSAMGPIFAKLW